MRTTNDVAGDLRAITDLHERLTTEAVQHADSKLMPGGLAMVGLAPVALPSRYGAGVDAAEEAALAAALEGADIDRLWKIIHGDDADDAAWEPPLQTLLFWSEAWREERGYPLGRRPTITSEASFLRWCLEWAWETAVHWDDFANDVQQARARVENLLTEGERATFRGVPCLYDECRGRRLVRKTVPTSDKNGVKTWVLSKWHCTHCHREWTEEEYVRNVYAAVERQRWLTTGDDTWCTIERAAQRVGRPAATVRSWMHRMQVASLCRIEPRTMFVRVSDIDARDQLARERHERWLRAVAANRGGEDVAVG